MFGSEGREQKRQFQESMRSEAEKNDTQIALSMSDPTRIGEESQISALLLDVQRKFLNYKLVVKDNNGRKEYFLQPIEQYDYKEPYGDEPLSFMEEQEERKLLNQFGMTISNVKQFADKNNLDWHLPFNDIVRKRSDFLLNSRTTGKPGKLAKSQFVQSDANISRQFIEPKKKGGLLGGLFG